jgi:hypothetical protein
MGARGLREVSGGLGGAVVYFEGLKREIMAVLRDLPEKEWLNPLYWSSATVMLRMVR